MLSYSPSLVIDCERQAEVDHYWEKLGDGVEEVQCGWLRDEYGLSWQIVATALRLVSDRDPARGHAGHAGHAEDDETRNRKSLNGPNAGTPHP